MAAASEPADPNQLSAEQRLHELTAIFAIGTARLLSLRADTPTSLSPQIPPESSPNGLDECPEKSVHAPRG